MYLVPSNKASKTVADIVSEMKTHHDKRGGVSGEEATTLFVTLRVVIQVEYQSVYYHVLHLQVGSQDWLVHHLLSYVALREERPSHTLRKRVGGLVVRRAFCFIEEICCDYFGFMHNHS